MNTFLKDGYKVPESNSGYMRLQKGDNVFRVLSSAVVGWQGWVDKKPQRFRMDEKPTDLRPFNGDIKHFWAFLVYNYEAEQIQILELTQKTIMRSIKGYIDDPDWGDVNEFDIKINKTGDGLETEYTVSPKPKAALSIEIADKFMNTKINLEALFTNENPFEEK